MFAGIDIGSSSVKASWFDGERFGVVKAPYRVRMDAREHDPARVVDAVRDAWALLVRSMHDSGIRGGVQALRGIGLSGHGPSVVVIDGDGLPLSPILTWQDNRAVAEAVVLRSQYERFAKDGSSYEAKLLWLADHKPEMFRPGCTVLYPKDYLYFLLTGERIIDTSAASTIVFYDRTKQDWHHALPHMDTRIFPRVVDSWMASGSTGTALSSLLGLADGVAVYPGGIDAYCGAIGAGGTVPGIIVEESGTSTCVSRCYSGTEGRDLHVLPGLSLSMKTITSTGAACDWIASVMQEPDFAQWEQGLDPDIPEPLVFLPYLRGERSPVWDERASGVWLGMTGETTRASIVHSVLQGTAFAIRQNIELLDQAASVHHTAAVHAVGGSARDALWLRMKANITGRTYHCMREHDAAAVGASMVAAVGAGAITAEDIPGLLPVQQTIEPDAVAVQAYGKLYRIYEQLYEANKPLMHELYGQRQQIGHLRQNKLQDNRDQG